MNLKQKTANGVLWSCIERFSAQGVTLVLGIFIARLLSPSDYGVIAMLSIFFAVFGTFADSGFSTALVRKIDRTESDNSTVFYFNIAVGVIASLIFFLIAPLIAKFFEIPLLEPIARVVSATVLINSFTVVHQALLTAEVNFKTQAKITMTSSVISGLLGLWSAFMGFGVWALVIQMMSSSILKSILLWILVKWRPTMPFSKESFRSLFSFGSKLLASALIDIIYNNSYTLVIGKFFNAASLGDYSRASQFAQFPSANITNIIQRVTFPVLSAIQNEDQRLAISYTKLLKMSAFVIFPLMVGLSAISKPLILILLTPKWEGAIILLQIICFSLMWYPIHAINLNLLQVKGRSDLFLRIEIIKKIMGIIILLMTIPMGLVAMCYGTIISSLGSLIINTHYTGKLINVGFLKQMKDLAPVLFASLFMGSVVCVVQLPFSSNTWQLIVGLITGGITYTLIILLFKFKEVQYIKEIILKQ